MADSDNDCSSTVSSGLPSTFGLLGLRKHSSERDSQGQGFCKKRYLCPVYDCVALVTAQAFWPVKAAVCSRIVSPRLHLTGARDLRCADRLSFNAMSI